MFLWALFWEIVGHSNNLFWTSLLIAPELAIANIAMVLLGWGFFVRWSGFSTLLFLLAIIYALLQLPAFLELELDVFLKHDQLETLDISFPLLAACQVMLSYGFLSLIRGSTAAGVEIDKPRYRLDGPRKVAAWVFPSVGGKSIRIAVDLVFGAVVAVLMYPIGGMLGPLLWRLVP